MVRYMMWQVILITGLCGELFISNEGIVRCSCMRMLPREVRNVTPAHIAQDLYILSFRPP